MANISWRENRLDVSMHYHRLQVRTFLILLQDTEEDIKELLVVDHLDIIMGNTMVVDHLLLIILKDLILMAVHQLIDGNHRQVLINMDLQQVGTMVNINNDINLTVINLLVLNNLQHLFNQNHQLKKKVLKINQRVVRNGHLMDSILIYQKVMMNNKKQQKTQT